MAEKRASSRERILKAALKLFSANGITATTTKEIAETAGVNEVTLFRQFGSKQGLLLAVIQEAKILDSMQASLADIAGVHEPIEAYGEAGLSLLARVPDLMRSLIGESAQFPLENRQALGQTLRQANLQTVGYLRAAQVSVPNLSQADLAGLINTLLIGYAVLTATSGEDGIWTSESGFLTALAQLVETKDPADAAITSASSSDAMSPAASEQGIVADLPADIVRSLFQKAKKLGPQEYALVYVLFGTGLRPEEILGLVRSQIFASKSQLLIRLAGDHPRQVPANRWIMGQRYGSYLKNPLTQWLKTRSDERPEVFITEDDNAITHDTLQTLWETITEGVTIYTGQPAAMVHARQTWCIEQLMKGMTLENLSILSGLSLESLAPYAQRAKEKAALAQALEIDQKSAST